jgi:hypothetical protein
VLEVFVLGDASFTALVKGPGFSPARNTPGAMKRRIAIVQREKQNEDEKSAPAEV